MLKQWLVPSEFIDIWHLKTLVEILPLCQSPDLAKGHREKCFFVFSKGQQLMSGDKVVSFIYHKPKLSGAYKPSHFEKTEGGKKKKEEEDF